MSTVRMYRKASATPTRKPTKAALAAAEHALALARVRRPDIEAFIARGGFHKLTTLTAAEVKDAGRRRRDYRTDAHAYTLTAADMGRASTNPQTMSMAAKTWLTTYYVATGVIGEDELAIVVDND